MLRRPVELKEHGRRAIRSACTRAPLGAKALRRLHPWSEPRTLRASGGQPVPTFRFGARGMVARQARIDGALEVRAFRRQHREAHVAFRAGDRAVRFPFGTYGARVHYGAPVEPGPHLDARVTEPGPLLDDVVRELTEREPGTSIGAPSFALLDEVESAFRDEAADIVTEAELDFDTAASPRTIAPVRTDGAGTDARDDAPRDDHGNEQREPARTRHRFDPRRDESARRLIVLRDRRRGRRPGRGGNHGSDPPG